jgi:hypothetical protein
VHNLTYTNDISAHADDAARRHPACLDRDAVDRSDGKLSIPHRGLRRRPADLGPRAPEFIIDLWHFHLYQRVKVSRQEQERKAQ